MAGVTLELTNVTMSDGSRWFLSLPFSVSWYELRDHGSVLPGGQLTGFLTDHVTEAWIDFSYRAHAFTIHTVMGEFWFFAENSTCDDEILVEIAEHFGPLCSE